MPNTKFYIDGRCGPGPRAAVMRLLPDIRSMLCEMLEVPPSACQFAVIEVAGIEDQAELSLELQMLPAPARTPERLGQVAERLRAMLSGPTGLRVVVRMSVLDPVGYVTLK